MMNDLHQRANHYNEESTQNKEYDSDQSSGIGSDHSEHSESEDDAAVRHQEYESRYKDKPPALASAILHICAAASVGFLFGFIMEKGRAFEPIHIQGQMLCGKLVLLKLMMAAVSSGMFFLSLMAMLPFTHGFYTQACIRFYGQLSDKGIMACLLGGAIMGCGMALAGSSPDLVWVQLGARVPHTGYVVGGAFLGALIYGLIKRQLYPVTEPFLRSSTNPWLDASYFVTALPLVAMFAMMVFAFEILIPWENEYKKHQLKHGADDSIWESYIWSPLVAGALVGALQVPMVICLQYPLGADNVYPIPISQFFVGPVSKLSAYFQHVRLDYRTYWQVVYICGVVYGSYYSADITNAAFPIRSVSVNHAVIGGVLLSFGSLMCGGSISIHGLTGMSMLSILSFITMFGVYVGGLCTAATLRSYVALIEGAAKQTKG